MDDRITIRPATPADAPALFALFAEEKAAELAGLSLAAEQLRPLLEMQYRGREFSYSQAAANLADDVLCLSDGTAVGRILIDRRADGIRVMDVAVLAAYRNRGIGTQALEQVQQAAHKASLPVRLRVMKGNAAGRLYKRLGFTSVSSDAISMELEWHPARTEAWVNPAAAERHSAVRHVDHDEIVRRVVLFLKEIGLAIEFGAITSGHRAGRCRGCDRKNRLPKRRRCKSQQHSGSSRHCHGADSPRSALARSESAEFHQTLRSAIFPLEPQLFAHACACHAQSASSASRV